MPTGLRALCDDGVHPGGFHHPRIRRRGNHGDHLDPAAMAVSDKLRTRIPHGNAEYGHAFVENGLESTRNEVRGSRGTGGDCWKPELRPHWVQGRLDMLCAL